MLVQHSLKRADTRKFLKDFCQKRFETSLLKKTSKRNQADVGMTQWMHLADKVHRQEVPHSTWYTCTPSITWPCILYSTTIPSCGTPVGTKFQCYLCRDGHVIECISLCGTSCLCTLSASAFIEPSLHQLNIFLENFECTCVCITLGVLNQKFAWIWFVKADLHVGS